MAPQKRNFISIAMGISYSIFTPFSVYRDQTTPMNSLYTTLKAKGYSRIKLALTKTNHIEIQGILNGRPATFILDTGASNSCLGFEAIPKFDLDPQESHIKAAGAGALDMDTQLSKRNHLQLGTWERKRISLVLFDLQHVNAALLAHQATSVDGIIGADILKRAKAVIDYNRAYLYLK